MFIGSMLPRSDYGNIEVEIQDQFSDIVNLCLLRQIQTMTYVSDGLINTNTIVLSGSQPINGSLIGIKQDKSFYQGQVLSSSASGANWTVIVDRMFDFSVVSGAIIREGSANMAIDGTISPKVYEVSTSGLNVKGWDITKIIGNMLATTAMDDSKFGGINALTKGLLLRRVNHTTKNIFNAKTNSDLMLDNCVVEYSLKAPAGQNGLTFVLGLSGATQQGVTIRLAGNDTIQAIVNDDLTGLTRLCMRIHGHVVE